MSPTKLTVHISGSPEGQTLSVTAEKDGEIAALNTPIGPAFARGWLQKESFWGVHTGRYPLLQTHFPSDEGWEGFDHSEKASRKDDVLLEMIEGRKRQERYHTKDPNGKTILVDILAEYFPNPSELKR